LHPTASHMAQVRSVSDTLDLGPTFFSKCHVKRACWVSCLVSGWFSLSLGLHGSNWRLAAAFSRPRSSLLWHVAQIRYARIGATADSQVQIWRICTAVQWCKCCFSRNL